MLRRARSARPTSGRFEVSARARAHGRGRCRQHRAVPVELLGCVEALAASRAHDGRQERSRREVEVRNRITGYVVQLDLDKHTVRLRDCPSSDGMGRVVFEGHADAACSAVAVVAVVNHE